MKTRKALHSAVYDKHSLPVLAGVRAGEFGAVFEVHGVVVVPAAAPDPAVPFEHLHQLQGEHVAVGDAPLPFPVPVPRPVRGVALELEQNFPLSQGSSSY